MGGDRGYRRRLTEKQRAVIRCRYYQGLTQEQTGRELGMSRSAASQLEASALRTLRHPVCSREQDDGRIVRKRRCKACGVRFKTLEQLQQVMEEES